MNADIKIRTMIRDGRAIGVVTIPTRRGPVTLRSVVPVEYVSRYLQRLQGDDEEIGWGFFKKITKKARRLAKRLAKSKVLKAALKVANNPVVSSFLPGSAVTALRYLEKGRRLVEKANQGNPDARALVAQVRAQAQFKRSPTPWNYQAARVLQRRNSRRFGRPIGSRIFATPLGKALQACAA